MRLNYILIVIGLLTLTSCGKGLSRKHLNLDKKIPQGRGISELERYRDEELGVVCYTVKSSKGISCLKE
jgi:hypothetical protein